MSSFTHTLHKQLQLLIGKYMNWSGQCADNFGPLVNACIEWVNKIDSSLHIHPAQPPSRPDISRSRIFLRFSTRPHPQHHGTTSSALRISLTLRGRPSLRSNRGCPLWLVQNRGSRGLHPHLQRCHDQALIGLCLHQLPRRRWWYVAFLYYYLMLIFLFVFIYCFYLSNYCKNFNYIWFTLIIKDLWF